MDKTTLRNSSKYLLYLSVPHMTQQSKTAEIKLKVQQKVYLIFLFKKCALTFFNSKMAFCVNWPVRERFYRLCCCML